MTPEQKKLYTAIKKECKYRGIKTHEELHDVISDKFYDDNVTGADYEIIASSLKLKR